MLKTMQFLTVTFLMVQSCSLGLHFYAFYLLLCRRVGQRMKLRNYAGLIPDVYHGQKRRCAQVVGANADRRS